MINLIIPAALVVAALFALILGAIFSRRNFFRGFLLFFLLLFLVGWSSELWITPFGPIWQGVSWFSLFFVSLIFSLFLLALTPLTEDIPRSSKVSMATTNEASSIALGIFFWSLIVLLVTSIAIGYYRIPVLIIK